MKPKRSNKKNLLSEKNLTKSKQTYFPYRLILIVLIVFLACSREKHISQEAYKKEQAGKKAEALFDYTRALEINPDYAFANKRVGFILSESPESQDVAIHHLEIARRESETDMEVTMKLFESYLLNGEFAKLKKLRGELSVGLDLQTFQLLDDIYNCMLKKDEAKNTAKKIQISFEAQYAKLFYRSWAACYEIAELPEKAEEIKSKYRNAD
ncbi:MAG TPA: hypothetical protein PLX69_23670 [Leptospiraceae bacterium]|nr:hypothetical protein [Leptospiraceae bacterium]HRG77579.1 hypothetical protein [Leptospiraceae bacterium]